MSTATATKEHPILFGGPMVRAILEGRKTQTRRVVKPQPTGPVDCGPGGEWWDAGSGDTLGNKFQFNQALWVRETWKTHERSDGLDGVLFQADGAFQGIENTSDAATDWLIAHRRDGKWRPSIFMPRWASRLTLRITDVRVQRAHQISDADALAEGIRTFTKDGRLNKYWACDPIDDHPPRSLYTTWQDMPRTPTEAFAALWDSINGKGEWAKNPWVWAISFERLPNP